MQYKAFNTLATAIKSLTIDETREAIRKLTHIGFDTSLMLENIHSNTSELVEEQRIKNNIDTLVYLGVLGDIAGAEIVNDVNAILIEHKEDIRYSARLGMDINPFIISAIGGDSTYEDPFSVRDLADCRAKLYGMLIGSLRKPKGDGQWVKVHKLMMDKLNDIITENRRHFKRSLYLTKVGDNEYIVDTDALKIPSDLVNLFDGQVKLVKKDHCVDVRLGEKFVTCRETIVGAVGAVHSSLKSLAGPLLEMDVKDMIEKTGCIDFEEIANRRVLKLGKAIELCEKIADEKGLVQIRYVVVRFASPSWDAGFKRVAERDLQERARTWEGAEVILDGLTYEEAGEVVDTLEGARKSKERVKITAANLAEARMKVTLLEASLESRKNEARECAEAVSKIQEVFNLNVLP